MGLGTEEAEEQTTAEGIEEQFTVGRVAVRRAVRRDKIASGVEEVGIAREVHATEVEVQGLILVEQA